MSEGFILNFNMFSDLALTLCIEIEEQNINTLYQNLDKIVTLSSFEDKPTKSKKEGIVYLNVTFNKGTGKLKQIIPSVPG